MLRKFKNQEKGVVFYVTENEKKVCCCFSSELLNDAFGSIVQRRINKEKKASEQESTVTITSDQKSEETKTDKNGEVYILYTSDVHCGIDQGFGYAGLKQMRDSLEAKGYETILVDDGDSLQGEFVGTMDKGETIIYLIPMLIHMVREE